MSVDLDPVTAALINRGAIEDSVGDLLLHLRPEHAAALQAKLEEYHRRMERILGDDQRTVITRDLHDTLAKQTVLGLLLREPHVVSLSQAQEAVEIVAKGVVRDAFLTIAAYNAGVHKDFIQHGTGLQDDVSAAQ